MISNLKDGTEEVARFKYMIGCDGAHSMVRKACQFTFEGSKYDETYASVDCKIEWDYSRDFITTFFL